MLMAQFLRWGSNKIGLCNPFLVLESLQTHSLIKRGSNDVKDPDNIFMKEIMLP